MDDDDFFGGSEVDAQKAIAERELRKMEQEFQTMGFRQGALEQIEINEREALNKGLYDGMQMTHIEGYLNGKIEFVTSLIQKLSKKLDASIITDIQKQLEAAQTKSPNEFDETSINEYFKSISDTISLALATHTAA